VGAFPREAERNGAPDAALRARDEDDLALTSHRCLLCRVQSRRVG
jgi:hypothetical protein